ncbi:hypothetical protein [Actimicrobium sp. CCI2.3]|uniref:hypothetical protein n=1 Tax=Actimicrobium sp. CCI2.3 TaxID=3048616 RepID=UPI002AB3FE63|nr:hypothetical protein [Actimicrobium sp. CCI2.3]MDY7574908.1 hypothetical protein [Actimicrobium sp. CCI2.3]MEB0023361.1 hypothetical protein [Actimicrobium sp. CCI2.3]
MNVKFVVYAVLVTALSTGVSWAKLIGSATSSDSVGSAARGSGWSSNTGGRGGSWGGGSGGHK